MILAKMNKFDYIGGGKMQTILIFFAVYLAIYLAMNLWAIRYRRKLVASVSDAKAATSDFKIHQLLDSFQTSMTSMRTSVILLAIFIQMLLEPKAKIKTFTDSSNNVDPLYTSGLMRDILESHMASAAAVNPFFGALAYLTRFFVHLRFKSTVGEMGGAREAQTITSRYAAC